MLQWNKIMQRHKIDPMETTKGPWETTFIILIPTVLIFELVFSTDLDRNYTSQDVHEEGAMDSTVYLLTNQVLQSIFEANLLPADILAQLQ